MVKLTIRILILSLLITGSVFSDGFLSLKLGVDGRSGGMGLATIALPGNCAAGFNNPAGLPLMANSQSIFTHHRWIMGVKSNFLGFSWKSGSNGFGLHLLYTDIGSLDHRLTATPQPAGTFSAHELTFGLSWGRQLRPNLYFGLTAKFLYEKIFIYDTAGAAIDGGLIWQPFNDGFTVGLRVRNLGRSGKLNKQRIDLPTSGGIGVAIPVNLPGGTWTVAADGVYYKDSGWYFYSGTEYGVSDNIYFRIGLQHGESESDLTAGLGLNLDKYHIDYSYMVLHSGLGDSHKITASFDL